MTPVEETTTTEAWLEKVRGRYRLLVRYSRYDPMVTPGREYP